jgi:hypothetical protein
MQAHPTQFAHTTINMFNTRANESDLLPPAKRLKTDQAINDPPRLQSNNNDLITSSIIQSTDLSQLPDLVFALICSYLTLPKKLSSFLVLSHQCSSRFMNARTYCCSLDSIKIDARWKRSLSLLRFIDSVSAVEIDLIDVSGLSLTFFDAVWIAFKDRTFNKLTCFKYRGPINLHARQVDTHADCDVWYSASDLLSAVSCVKSLVILPVQSGTIRIGPSRAKSTKEAPLFDWSPLKRFTSLTSFHWDVMT